MSRPKPRIRLRLCRRCGRVTAPMGTTPALLSWAVQRCPACRLLSVPNPGS